MSDHIDKTLGDLQLKLNEQEEAVIQTKRLINLLCEHAGRPVLYMDADMSVSGKAVAIQSDQFYGQPLSTAMREILEMRKTTNLGPATPKEIYNALIEGGYAFETDNEANRLTGVRISLRKSSSVFHRMPNGKQYGLLAWYPKAKKSKTNQETVNTESISEPDVIDEALEEGEE